MIRVKLCIVDIFTEKGTAKVSCLNSIKFKRVETQRIMRASAINDSELQSLSDDSEDFIEKASRKLKRRNRKDLMKWPDMWANKPKLDQVYSSLWPKLQQAEKDTIDWGKEVDERRQSAIVRGASVSSRVESEIFGYETRLNCLEDIANDCLQLQYDASNAIMEEIAVLTFHCVSFICLWCNYKLLF